MPPSISPYNFQNLSFSLFKAPKPFSQFSNSQSSQTVTLKFPLTHDERSEYYLLRSPEMRPTPAARRRPTDSFNPPPTPLDYHNRQFAPPRDSDASFASSRPSSAGHGRPVASIDLYKDRSFQQSALATIKSYLAGFNVTFSFKGACPSAKEIFKTLEFLMTRLDYPQPKFEEDLPLLLKTLKCPFKLNKSILKTPAAPHQWPAVLAVIHWLVQVAMYNDHLSSSQDSVTDNALYMYTLESYLHFINGDDEAVDELDRECKEKLEKEKGFAVEKLNSLEQNLKELEVKLEALRTGPSLKEKLEKEKEVLEGDVGKFHKMIDELTVRIVAMEKALVDKEKDLEMKLDENRKICEENEELKKRVELQVFNSRDVERMKRELQAVERDIGEAELSRNVWEEKTWDVDAMLGNKFKELEAQAMECNQCMRRLKLGNGFQYQLNSKGSTPAEIMGVDYKSTIRPQLITFLDDLKKGTMSKLEELISLQKQSRDNDAKIEEKKDHLAAIQSHVDGLETQLDILKKEIQDYTSKCAAEARKLVEEVEQEAHNLQGVERDATDVLKTSKLKLQEAIKQSEEEIQIRAQNLFQLIDAVSQYKEFVESKISAMKTDLSETAVVVSEAYKSSLPAKFISGVSANSC